MTKQLRQAITPTHMLGSTGTDVGSSLGHCSLGALPTLTSTSTVTATKLVPTGNVTAGNGMYLPAANTLAWSTNGSERMRILADGKTGFGLTAPNEVVEVAGNIHVSGGDRTIFNRSNNSLAFGTNNTERVRITSTGLVGLNVTPTENLHVRGLAGSNGVLLLERQDVGSLKISAISGTPVAAVFSTGDATAGDITQLSLVARSGGGSIAGTVRVHNYFLVNESTSIINASAQVEIASTTRGFLPPRMTGTQRDAISTPAAGLIVYSTTSNKLNFYNGSAWRAVDDSAV